MSFRDYTTIITTLDQTFTDNEPFKNDKKLKKSWTITKQKLDDHKKKNR